MIITHLNDAARYNTLHPRFEQAFDWLREHDGSTASYRSTASPGRIDIDGENLFVMYNIGQGEGREGIVLEAHRRYLDIHFSIEGVEELGWKSTPHCAQRKTSYDENSDVEIFEDAPESWSTLPAKTLAIVWPEDAHAPMCGIGPVRKYVVKVLLEE